MSELHYFTFGTGEIKVLLVHGWAASGRMWESVHPHFKTATFFALEFMGFGRTACPENPPTINEHVASLIAFADEIKPQVIIAHSMGGLITLKAIHQRPDLAEQLVLICPVVTGRFGLNGLGSGIIGNSFAGTALRSTQTIWPAIQKDYLVKMFMDPFQSYPELNKRMQQDFLELSPKAAIEALISMAGENMRDYLGEIQQPTLVCVGEQDLTVPPSEGKTAAELLPNAELALFKSRHHPMDEATEAFLPVLKEFLGRFGVE